MKITLPLVTGLPWLQPMVTAELVEVAPHIEGATFAVHRCHDRGGWKVTHIETGFAGSAAYATKAMAVKKARIFYRDMTQATFDEAVAKAVTAAPWIADPKITDIFTTNPSPQTGDSK
jgi:hypothetical protein